MATLMATALAGSGIAAGAAGAASAGAAAAGTSSLFNAFTIGSTLVSGLAAIQSGNAQASALRGQANQAEFEADQELVKGEQETASALEALNDDLGRAIVAGYANGLQGSGSVGVAIDEAREQGQFNVNTTRDNAVIQSSLRRTNAKQLRTDARSASEGGLFAAVGQVGQAGARIFKRG